MHVRLLMLSHFLAEHLAMVSMCYVTSFRFRCPPIAAAAAFCRCHLLISLEVIRIHACQTADAKSFPRGAFSYGVYVLCEILSLPVSTHYCSCYVMPMKFTYVIRNDTDHAHQTPEAQSFPRGAFSYGVYVLCEILSLPVCTH